MARILLAPALNGCSEWPNAVAVNHLGLGIGLDLRVILAILCGEARPVRRNAQECWEANLALATASAFGDPKMGLANLARFTTRHVCAAIQAHRVRAT